MKPALVLLLLAVTSCTRADRPASGLTISLRHGSPSERATQQQLERLARTYDLAPWRITSRIAIDDDAIPHSHPLLTLHTRHAHDDLLLLSTFIHEESHWILAQHDAETAAAVTELHALVATLPVGYPDGAVTLESSYQHLLVIALEQHGLRRLVGELATREVMEFWATDHYRALYRWEIDHAAAVWSIARAHHLAGPLAT